MKKNLVVKDNALINASYALDLIEQRIILLAILEARGKGVATNTDLTVHADSYINHFGTHKNTAYSALKSACETLFDRRFSYQKLTPKGNIEHVKSRWVQRISYVENEALIRFRFSDDVIPLIVQLEQHFTSYELEQVSSLTSVYAIRLYELLIAWRSTGNVSMIELQDFRRKLGIEDGEYKRMGQFKEKVLGLAIDQINAHTDIVVDYEQHKAGRTITGFSFSFQHKKPKKTEKSATKSKPKPQNNQLDLLNNETLERFNSCTKEQQKAIVDKIEKTLTGVKQARFKVAKTSNIEKLVAEFATEINEGVMSVVGLV